MTCKIDVKWVDDKRDPKSPPDRNDPTGKDVVAYDARRLGVKACKAELPYPAKRCGWYVIKCSTCDQQLMISTAGRIDDPKSVTFECKGATGGRV